MPVPFFKISCLEHVLYQPQKSVIVNAFTQNVQEDLVIESPKTVGNVAFDEPMDALPSLYHFTEGCVRSPPWAETMRAVGKSRLKVGVKELAHHFLHDL